MYVCGGVTEGGNCSEKLGGLEENICLCFDSKCRMRETLFFLLGNSYSPPMCPAVIIFHDKLF